MKLKIPTFLEITGRMAQGPKVLVHLKITGRMI
jgi:hypothetical protein